MKVGRKAATAGFALLAGLLVAYLGDLTGIIRTQIASSLWERIKDWRLVKMALAEPMAAAVFIVLCGLLLLLWHERHSGLADIRYAGHGSKQFYIDGDLKRPAEFWFQARFSNQSQREAKNVSALAWFWGRHSLVRKQYCRWAAGRPASDSPQDTGFKSTTDVAEILPGHVHSRLNLAVRPMRQNVLVVYAHVITNAHVLDAGPILVRVNLSGIGVNETSWLILRNVTEADRERAIAELWPPRAWCIWLWLAMSRWRSKPSSSSLSGSVADVSAAALGHQERPGPEQESSDAER